MDEAGQALEFLVTTSDDDFFTQLREISPTGTLTYETAPNVNGVVTITVQLQYDGGTDRGGVDTSVAQTFKITVKAVNDLPTLEEIDEQTTAEDTPTAPIAITVGDLETPADSLKLTAKSSDTKLIPAKNIVFGGTGEDRTMIITPAANLFGSAIITVTDGNKGTATRTFVINVDSVNDLPTIANIADVTIDEDKMTSAIKFKIDDVEDKLVNLNNLTVNFGIERIWARCHEFI